MTKGVTVPDVHGSDFVKAYARHLKRSGKVVLPKWVDIVKTSVTKELPPSDPDWFYIRTASIARKFYFHNGTGVGGLMNAYGDAKRRGSKPKHHHRASGAVIRAAVKQLEALLVLEKDPKGGRRLSSTGRRDLDRIASQTVPTKKI